LSLDPGNFEEKDFMVERTGAVHMCKNWERVYEFMGQNMEDWLKEKK